MKTFLITEPGKFTYSTQAEPSPAPGEILLQIRRIGFCGTDLNIFRGLNPLVIYPCLPGHEIAATIVEVTKGVPDQFVPGQEATVLPYTACGKCSSCGSGRRNACRYNKTLGVQQPGAFTEFLSVPWQNVIVSRLSRQDLALVEPLAVGFHAARRGRVTPRDHVVVFGCGMIGLGAIAASAKRYGATVTAVDLESSKLDLARRAGATHTINSREENLHDRLLALTDGHGPSVIIEAVGAAATFRAAVDEVAFAGRVVYIGYAKEPVSYETKLFVMKELDILGSRNSSMDDFSDVIGMLSKGDYPSDATVTTTVDFSEAGQALEAWSEAPGGTTKIHVTIS